MVHNSYNIRPNQGPPIQLVLGPVGCQFGWFAVDLPQQVLEKKVF